MEQSSVAPNHSASGQDLSTLVIMLLKGVIYREDDPRLWNALLQLQAQVRDHVAVMDLELMIDDAEGYGFLRSRPRDDDDGAAPKLPRLIARRPLSFPVSLLLALLRKKLAEFDAGGSDARLVLSRDEMVDMLRIFLPDSSNEVRLVEQIGGHIARIEQLGFLRRLKASAAADSYEVRRILKAFVDAQWLADFDARLAEYLAHAGMNALRSDDDE